MRLSRCGMEMLQMLQMFHWIIGLLHWIASLQVGSWHPQFELDKPRLEAYDKTQ